jgi:hypothetical protein
MLRHLPILGVVAAVTCTFAARAATAAPWIDMGPKDEFAFDQPIVSFELFHQLPGGAKGSTMGPTDGGFFFVANQFILDTGATSTIAMNDALTDLEDHGYVTVNTVLEQGVSGFEEIDVSDLYFMEITDSGPSVIQLPNTHIMSGQFPDLFGINGIVGMPAMQGRVVTLDTSVWAEVEDIFDIVPMGVHFSNSLPASNGHRYSVPLVAREFHVIGEGILPNEAPIGSLEMGVGFGNLTATGTFVLDTGAAISFISTELGKAIGLDSNNDGVLDTSDEQSDGTIPIGGIGGTSEVPLFYIDRFIVPTEQGVDLVWNLEGFISVAIVDIDPSIDGVLGADLMTSGWFTFLFEEGAPQEESPPGPVRKLHFDFTQFQQNGDPGTMYFDLTPEFDVVQPDTSTGDFNNDGMVDAADFVWWVKNGGSPEDYELWSRDYATLPGATGTNGDFNDDGAIDVADYVMWRKLGGNNADYLMWQQTFGVSLPGSGGSAAAGVPEPSVVVLLIVAACGAALSRKRVR